MDKIDIELDRTPSFLSVAGWFSLLIGWLIAGIYANGEELQRFAIVVPFVSVGALLVLLGEKFVRWRGWLVVGTAILYLLTRGAFSVVWDLGRLDMVIIALGGLSFVAAQTALSHRLFRQMLFGAALLLFLGNIAVAVYQIKHDDYAWSRGIRLDVAGVSGFYFHRNYFAGFLALFLPLMVGYASVNLKRWVLILPIIVIGFYFCFLSNSRGGFVTSALACFLVYSFGVSQSDRRSAGSKKLLLVLLLAFVSIFIGIVFWQKIVVSRSLDIADNIQSRLAMSGVAFESWMGSFWFGNGGQSYSYEFPRLVDSSIIGGYFGDARRAHCDYLQLLSDYGFFGLLFVASVIAYLAFSLWPRKVSTGLFSRVAFVVLLTESLRAGFDFNLRLLPNLMLFAMLMGGGIGERSEKGGSIIGRVLQPLLVLILGCLLIFVMRNEIRYARKWVAFERAVLKGDGKTALSLKRSYLAKAPEFHQLRLLARFETKLATDTGKQSDLVQATDTWERTVERHEVDGESLANLAFCYDELGRFDEAEPLHLRAILAVGNREDKYGVFHGAALHLAKRALSLSRQRKPSEALALFEEALAFHEESQKRNYRLQDDGRVTGSWLRQHIDFLKGARVEPTATRSIKLDEVLLMMREG